MRAIYVGYRLACVGGCRDRGIDQRVGALEIKDLDRSRFRQAAGRVTLVLLVPVIVAATQVHEWFNTVNDIIFPRK